jgi:hypothetical protein
MPRGAGHRPGPASGSEIFYSQRSALSLTGPARGAIRAKKSVRADKRIRIPNGET